MHQYVHYSEGNVNSQKVIHFIFQSIVIIIIIIVIYITRV